MNNRNFSEWLLGFRDSIADYGYYIDLIRSIGMSIILKLNLIF